MKPRDGTLARVAAAGVAGVLVLAATFALFFWRGSIRADEEAVGSLADALGARAEAMILDARTLLQEFERLPQGDAASLRPAPLLVRVPAGAHA
ncbi:MAG TPA: hypothetical protein PK788_09005, partial [Gemmatimonadaceae bacterium]|nr:hypothetical protein [Gemmatimonadaceae bacterium]